MIYYGIVERKPYYSLGYLHPETAQDLEALRHQIEHYIKQFGENSKEVLKLHEELGAISIEALNQLWDYHRN